MSEITTNTNELINDISVLINNAKVRVAIKANAERTILYTFDISRFCKLNFGIRLCSHTICTPSLAHRLFNFQILKYLRYTGIEILKSTRAEYGQEVIKTLVKGLSSLYGRGFTYTALVRMNLFYQSFRD